MTLLSKPRTITLLGAAGLAAACGQSVQGESAQPTGTDDDPVSSGDGDGMEGDSATNGGEESKEALSIDAPALLERPLVWNVLVDIPFASDSANAETTWSLASGDLPNGLSLSESGVLQGKALETGEFTFVVRVVDAQGAEGELSVTLLVESRSWIAYQVSDGADGTYTLALANLAPELPTRFDITTSDTGVLPLVSFSPDGKSVLFTEQTEEFGECALMGVDLTAEHLAKVRVGERNVGCYSLHWSPEGDAAAVVQSSVDEDGMTVGQVPAIARWTESGFELNEVPDTALVDYVFLDGFIGEHTLVVTEDFNAMRLYDLEDGVLINSRSLTAATSAWAVAPKQQRVVGSNSDGGIIVDVDDGWSAPYPTHISVSPGGFYLHDASTLEGVIRNVYPVDAFLEDPAPTIREFELEHETSRGGAHVWFSGDRDRYLIGQRAPEAQSMELWKVDLEGDAPPEVIVAPDSCVPTPLRDTEWFSCTVSSGGPQQYLYRPRDMVGMASVLPETGFEEVYPNLVVSPDQSGTLHKLRAEGATIWGVYASAYLGDDQFATPQRISPDPSESVTGADSSSIDIGWTADGLFGFYVMNRQMPSSAFVKSSAIWATEIGEENGRAFNVSATNRNCTTSMSYTWGDNCLNVQSVVTQPRVPPFRASR